MAKSPIKNPPSDQVEVGVESAPTLVVESSLNSTNENSADARPTLDPPASLVSGFEDSFTAGVWNNNKKVNALFATNDTRNAWMSIIGTGWVKLANNIDSANEALNILATAAKVKNSPINYLQDGGLVTQIYVW